MDKNNRIVSQHFKKVRKKLLEFARHFDIAEHGDIKGYGREVLVSEFLSEHLPSEIDYLTGEIIDEEDNRSGQIDIILQSQQYPKIPLFGNIHLSYSDAVMSIIEVKSTLTKQHLEKALKSFKKIKDLKRNVTLRGSKNSESLEKIPCIIFAFRGPTSETLLKNINQFASEYDLNLEEFAPDLIVTLDSDYYIFKNNGWFFKKQSPNDKFYLTWQGIPHENLVGLYHYITKIAQSYRVKNNFFNVGTYFKKLNSQRS